MKERMCFNRMNALSLKRFESWGERRRTASQMIKGSVLGRREVSLKNAFGFVILTGPQAIRLPNPLYARESSNSSAVRQREQVRMPPASGGFCRPGERSAGLGQTRYLGFLLPAANPRLRQRHRLCILFSSSSWKTSSCPSSQKMGFSPASIRKVDRASARSADIR